MDSEQRRNLATTTIGTGLVASGGVARHSAVRQAERIKKLPRKSGALPSAILRHGGLGRQRALWLAGAAGGFAGATGMGVGASNMVRDWKGGKADEQKDTIKPFWQEGLSGTAQATRDRLNEARKPKPPKALAAQAAVAGGAGALGSLAAHRSMDHLGRKKYPSLLSRHSRVRPAVAALTGTAAAIASLPASNRAVRHFSPGYEAVAGGGVRRKKTAHKRPTSGTSSVELRSSRGASPGARGQIVPSSFGKSNLTSNQRRLAVEAGYATPVVGALAGPAVAAQLAPHGDKASSASWTAGGRTLGSGLGAAAGAYGAAALAQRHPKIQTGSDKAAQHLNTGRQSLADKLPKSVGRHVAPKEGRLAERVGRMAGHSNPVVRSAGRAMLHASGPLKAAPAAATLAGLAGSKIGGFAGGQGGYSMALRGEAKHQNELSRKGTRTVIKYAGMADPLTSRERVDQYRRKRRALALTAGGTVIGAAGTAAYGASLLTKHPANKAKLERIGIHTAIGGGTLGAASGLNSIGVQRRALRDEKAQLQRKKALPTPLVKGMRRSSLRMVPTQVNGVSKPVRVKNAVVTKGVLAPLTGSLIGSATTYALGHVASAPLGRRVEQAALRRGKHPEDAKHLGQLTRQFVGSLSTGPGAVAGSRAGARVGRFRKIDDRDKQVAGGAAAGGYLGSPGKPISGLKAHGALARIREQGPGTHQVAVRDLAPYRRGPGRRFGDRAHTAGVAMSIKEHGWDESKPIQAHVYRNRVHISDGAHRMWGAEMLGQSHVPVNLVHHNTKAPRTQTVLGQRVSDLHAMRHRGQVARDSHMDGAQLARLADKKPTGWQADMNAKRSRAGARATMAPLSRAVHARRMAIGTALGGSAAALATRPKNKPVKKIDTTMDHQTAQQYKAKYGLRGPLPKGLARDEKMRAYEGRYVAAGGPKGEKHQRRADRADRVTGASLAVGGGSAFGTIAGRHPKVMARHPRLHGRSDVAGLGAAGVGALSELYHRHQEHKARSYSSSPAGVAASALRRMRDYTPD